MKKPKKKRVSRNINITNIAQAAIQTNRSRRRRAPRSQLQPNPILALLASQNAFRQNPQFQFFYQQPANLKDEFQPNVSVMPDFRAQMFAAQSPIRGLDDTIPEPIGDETMRGLRSPGSAAGDETMRGMRSPGSAADEMRNPTRPPSTPTLRFRAPPDEPVRSRPLPTPSGEDVMDELQSTTPAGVRAFQDQVAARSEPLPTRLEQELLRFAQPRFQAPKVQKSPPWPDPEAIRKARVTRAADEPVQESSYIAELRAHSESIRQARLAREGPFIGHASSIRRIIDPRAATEARLEQEEEFLSEAVFDPSTTERSF